MKNKQFDSEKLTNIKNLMLEYARTLGKLCEKENGFTHASPVGNYAEILVSEKLGLTPAQNASQAGYDAEGADGKKYQIKARWEYEDKATAKSRELGIIRDYDKQLFDFLAAVIFDKNFEIKEAYCIPYEDIKSHAKKDGRSNGLKLVLKGPALDAYKKYDITDKLRENDVQVSDRLIATV